MAAGVGEPAYQAAPQDEEASPVRLCRTAFVLSWNPQTRVADWVLEYLTVDHLNGDAKRRSRFLVDRDLPAGLRLSHDDYTVSREDRARGMRAYDRGHLAPAANMRWSGTAMRESFFMSNVAPQDPHLNQQAWRFLEEDIRKWARLRAHLIVITGPLYGAEPGPMPNGAPAQVPDSYWKIVYDPETRETLAFLFANAPSGIRDFSRVQVSINTIEEKSGLDFFPLMDSKQEARIEASRMPLWPTKGGGTAGGG